MDNIDFSDFEDIVKDNFYSDDFAYFNLNGPDANGNVPGYKNIPTSDTFFDNPSELDSEEDFF